MPRRLPEHVWETKLHRAHRRVDESADESADASRTRREVLDLRFREGQALRAELDLAQQVVDPAAAADGDLVHAVSCWLIARGARQIRLTTTEGRVLAEGPLRSADLGRTEPSITAPRTLVSLAPSNLEMVDALGAFPLVLACEESSDHPPACAALERLGPDLNPDLDRVGALRPDLVVSSLSVPGMERVVTGLRARGIEQVVLAPRRFDDVLEEALLLGRLLRRDREAAALVEELSAERARLASRAAASGEPLRVYLEWWPKPMFTPGADCYSNELIALAGGRNVFADRPGSSLQIDAAELLAKDPEACFVSWCGVAEEKLDPKRLIERDGLSGLAAAREGRVFPLDERFSGRPGPRMLEASRRMALALAEVRTSA